MVSTQQKTQVRETENEVENTMQGPQAETRKYDIVYLNVIVFAYFHLAGLYGVYLCWTQAKWTTLIFGFVMLMLSGLSVTAGAHRLWTHRTYKAKLPLEILLMLMNCIASQNSAIVWIRDHRLHHKHTDTDADPHNATRGFFFSHVGWLLVKKHPDVKKYGKQLDMSDVYSNPVLQFQKKYIIPLSMVIAFGMPTIVPVYCWNEAWSVAWHATLLRYAASLNFTFMVNSVAHIWGNKPYDKHILPTQNLAVSLFALGEGFHNYHHVFPWDYRTAELGNNYLNMTTLFIDLFARIGWAYDLKTVSEDMIRRRALRTGDGTNLWGWGDKDMSKETKCEALILHPKNRYYFNMTT